MIIEFSYLSGRHGGWEGLCPSSLHGDFPQGKTRNESLRHVLSVYELLRNNHFVAVFTVTGWSNDLIKQLRTRFISLFMTMDETGINKAPFICSKSQYRAPAARANARFPDSRGTSPQSGTTSPELRLPRERDHAAVFHGP